MFRVWMLPLAVALSAGGRHRRRALRPRAESGRRRSRAVDPVYPTDALRAGIQGVVILEIVVGADGAVASARILRSIPLLDQAALTPRDSGATNRRCWTACPCP
jgi:hypothetical protein